MKNKELLFGVALLTLCLFFNSCSKDDSDTKESDFQKYERQIVGVWTGTYVTESGLGIIFKRYSFNESHVVRCYSRRGSRVSYTSQGITTYTDWEITEENQTGEWVIEERGYEPSIHIEWNGGSKAREYFPLRNFTGATLRGEGNLLLLYKGDSNPDF